MASDRVLRKPKGISKLKIPLRHPSKSKVHHIDDSDEVAEAQPSWWKRWFFCCSSDKKPDELEVLSEKSTSKMIR